MIELRGISWDHTRGYDPLVATARAYMREHADVRIEWDKRSLHDFGHAPVDRLAQQYDLVVLDHPWIGFMADTQCYVALNDLLPAEVLEDLAAHSAGPAHASYEWEGRQWALAIDAATPSASYRPDLLRQLQSPVPKTWDEVLELGFRCEAAGMNIALPLGPIDAITAFLSLADNLGGNPFATTDYVTNEAVGRRVLSALQAIVKLCPAEVYQLSPITLMDLMSSTDSIAYCPLAYSYSNYARAGFRPHLCRYANMPTLGTKGPQGSHIGGTGLAVSSRCQHPQIAADYASRVAGGEWQKSIYFSAGGQPAHAAAWNDSAVNAACSNFFADTRETIDRAFLRPRYNGYIDFQYRGGALIMNCLRDDGDHNNLLNELNALYCESTRCLA
jgi:multiple sugar transport system substrate-binding protein